MDTYAGIALHLQAVGGVQSGGEANSDAGTVASA